MNTKLKYIIALIVIMPALNLSYLASTNTTSSDQSMQSVTLSDGFVVPSDDQGVTEPELDVSYVQGKDFDTEFTAVNLEGISSQIATEIVQVETQADGTSLVLLREYNTSDVLAYDTPLYERSSLLRVDNRGVVIKSYNLGAGFAANGIGAVSDSYTNSIYDLNTQYAASSRLIRTPSGYKVYYVKRDANMNKVGYSFVLDETLDFDNIAPRENLTGQFVDNPIAVHVYNDEMQSFATSDFALIDAVFNDETNVNYQMFNLDVGLTSTVYKNLDFPTWQQMTGNQFTTGSKTLNSDIYVMPDKTFVGMVKATTGDIEYNGFVIWNEDGTIKAQYLPWYENEVRLLPELSTPEYLFFQENKNGLKKVNLQTGYMTLVKSYPSDTDLGIQPYNDQEYGSSYLYYGYVKSFRGIFTGFSIYSGAVIGLMDSNFNVLTANVTPTEYPITMDLSGKDSSNIVAYGNLGENRNFANEPSPGTNSIGNQGWVDKVLGLSTLDRNDVYIGKMALFDDYSPAIKVGGPVIINKDEVEVGESLTSKLLDSVEVYDKSDLDPNKQENLNLTTDEIYQSLFKRINKSPYNLDADIEWENLGLDYSQIGYNQVKYFVTDTNQHPTATSKAVNIIDSSTKVDSTNQLALSAENIVLTLDQARSLETSSVLSLSNAKSWNIINGQDLTNTIGIDQSQLSEINNSSAETVLPLDLTLTYGNNSITKQIKVFIGGTYDAVTDVIIFGCGFNLKLDDASSLNQDIAMQKAQISAYKVMSGERITDDKLEVDLQSILKATEVGNYKMAVSTAETSKQIAVNLYDSTTVLNDKEAIDAHNIILTEQQISGITNVLLKKLIQDKSYVKTWNLVSGSPVGYSIDISQVKMTVGVYPVTFTTDNDTVKIINVYVLENPTCDGLNCDAKLTTMVIDAINFDLEVAQVYSLTPIMVLQLSHSRAYNIDENTSLKLDLDYSQIEAVTGSYDVIITTDFDLSKKIKAVVGEDVVIVPDPDPDSEVDSEVTSETESEATSETESEATSETESEATSEAESEMDNESESEVDNESEIISEVTSEIVSDIKTEASKTKDKGSIVPKPKEALAVSGKDVFFSLEELSLLKEREKFNEEILKRSQARVWLVESNKTLNPLVIDSNAVEYKPNQGEPIELETNNSSTQTIESLEQTYGESLQLHTDGDESIAAVDFGLTVQEVESLTNSEVKLLSNSVAWNVKDMSNVDISSVDFSAIKRAQGIYPVKFSTKSGTALEVNAYVGQTNRPVFTGDGHVIFANNLEITEVSSKKDSGSNLVEAANSVIIDQATLTEEPVAFFQGNYDLETPGMYTANIGLDADDYATIEVTVAPNALKAPRIPIKFLITLVILSISTSAITYFIFKSKRLG